GLDQEESLGFALLPEVVLSGAGQQGGKHHGQRQGFVLVAALVLIHLDDEVVGTGRLLHRRGRGGDRRRCLGSGVGGPGGRDRRRGRRQGLGGVGQGRDDGGFRLRGDGAPHGQDQREGSENAGQHGGSQKVSRAVTVGLGTPPSQ